MNNEHKYSLFRLFHFCSGLLLGALFLLSARRNRRIIFNSSHNKSFNFNSKFLFEYFLKHHPDWESRFVIDDDRLRSELNAKHGPYFISSRGIRNKVYILRASTWITSSLETPVGGLGLSFRRLVINMGHGTPIKATGLADIKASWIKKAYYLLVRTNFSYFLAASEEAAIYVRRAFGCDSNKILISSQPRISPLLKPLQAPRENKGISILYAPTWRKQGEPLLFPFLDYNKSALDSFLRQNAIHIFLRLHPYYENSDYVAQFLSRNVSTLSSVYEPEIMDVLANYDALITDYSSIYVDFLILNRPIIFFPYDLEDFTQNTGFMDSFERLSPGPHIHSQLDFLKVLSKISEGVDEHVDSRKALNVKLNGRICRNPCHEIFKFVQSQSIKTESGIF